MAPACQRCAAAGYSGEVGGRGERGARRAVWTACLVIAAQPAAVAAAPPSVPASTQAGTNDPPRRSSAWIVRHRPTRQRIELGVFGGVILPHPAHELYAPLTGTWTPMARVAPSLGLRAGYYPLSFLGLEVEGSLMPVRLDCTCGERGLMYAARGQVVGQLPLASVAPFVAIGGGALGVRSARLGGDVDAVSHFGGGLKIFAHRYVGVRVDVRATVASRVGLVGGRIAYPEVLLGLVVPLGLLPRDRDGDGLFDPGQKARPVDRCPDVAGSSRTQGCGDRDGDAIADLDDRCPDAAGGGERRGCPPLRDGDGDGVFDPGQVDIPPPGGDQCPEIAGMRDYIGCPPPDSDGDGLVDPSDGCPDARETINGFEDEDGCPDEVPVDVATLVGTFRGINFAFMSDEITLDSRPALDHAVEVMRQYPTIRIEIQGHTDQEGDPRVNQTLSTRRAEAVRAYIGAAGIAVDRMRAVGFGGDRPIADNATPAGKAKNRRIELYLLDAAGQVLVPGAATTEGPP